MFKQSHQNVYLNEFCLGQKYLPWYFQKLIQKYLLITIKEVIGPFRHVSDEDTVFFKDLQRKH